MHIRNELDPSFLAVLLSCHGLSERANLTSMCSIMHIDKLATKALGISSIATFSLLCCDVIEEMSIDSARARDFLYTCKYRYIRVLS